MEGDSIWNHLFWYMGALGRLDGTRSAPVVSMDLLPAEEGFYIEATDLNSAQLVSMLTSDLTVPRAHLTKSYQPEEYGMFVQVAGLKSEFLIANLTSIIPRGENESAWTTAIYESSLDVAFATPFAGLEVGNFTPSIFVGLHLPDLPLLPGILELKKLAASGQYTPKANWKLGIDADLHLTIPRYSPESRENTTEIVTAPRTCRLPSTAWATSC
jgi:hypothetical protein